MKRFWSILICIATVISAAAPEIAAQKKERPPSPRGFLPYEVVDGDTLFYDVLKPSQIYAGKMKGKEWRKYYKLVWNFSRTYPYAQVARRLVDETDSTFEEKDFGRRKKEKYVNRIQDELFEAFEEPLRSMTISQGQLLMKLIDREVGKSSFAIIKEYKNGIAAGFWQGIAKMFGTDLKKNYDPEGEDRDVEELVRKWENGEFPELYFSIFGEYPKRLELPSKYM